MKPRNVIVTFECRNTIPAKDIVAGLEERLAGLGLVERPRANVVRRAKCMDPTADGPPIRTVRDLVRAVDKVGARVVGVTFTKSKKPASKSVAANRRRK